MFEKQLWVHEDISRRHCCTVNFFFKLFTNILFYNYFYFHHYFLYPFLRSIPFFLINWSFSFLFVFYSFFFVQKCPSVQNWPSMRIFLRSIWFPISKFFFVQTCLRAKIFCGNFFLRAFLPLCNLAFLSNLVYSCNFVFVQFLPVP